MFNDFNDFDNLFNLVWNRWNAPVKDTYPYHVYEAPGKGFMIVCKTLGISKENISVRVEKVPGTQYSNLKICGETINDDKVYFKNKVDLNIGLKIKQDDIKNVNYNVKDGLTTVYIETKQPEKEKKEPGIEGKYIDDSNLDW